MTFFQWLLPTFIAAFVAMIGYFQWRTAHQRVVLDLFDRRMKVYEEARRCAAYVVAHGNMNPQIEREMAMTVEDSRFVFGDEIRIYLDGIYKSMLDVAMHESVSKGLQGGDLEKALGSRRAAFDAVELIFSEGPKKFEPYLKLDQKIRRFRLFGG